MKPRVDPEGVEVSHFISASHLAGKKVLEIGCGQGSLTYQYVGLPDLVVGIDSAFSELIACIDHQPAAGKPISLVCAKGEALPFRSQFFDIVIFASSL